MNDFMFPLTIKNEKLENRKSQFLISTKENMEFLQ